MKCAHCGAPLAEESTWCVSCGTQAGNVQLQIADAHPSTLAEAMRLFEGECYNDVVAVCAKLIEINPQSDQAYTILGDAYVKLGNDRAALNAYQQAILHNPVDSALRARYDQIIDRTFSASAPVPSPTPRQPVAAPQPAAVEQDSDDWVQRIIIWVKEHTTSISDRIRPLSQEMKHDGHPLQWISAQLQARATLVLRISITVIALSLLIALQPWHWIRKPTPKVTVPLAPSGTLTSQPETPPANTLPSSEPAAQPTPDTTVVTEPSTEQPVPATADSPAETAPPPASAPVITPPRGKAWTLPPVPNAGGSSAPAASGTSTL